MLAIKRNGFGAHRLSFLRKYLLPMLLLLRRKRSDVRNQIQDLLFGKLAAVRRHYGWIPLHDFGVRSNDRLANVTLIEFRRAASFQRHVRSVQAAQLRAALSRAGRMAIDTIEFREQLLSD